LLLIASVTLLLLFPAYEPLAPTGPYAVATARYTYIHESRIEEFTTGAENRKVNVTV
jgi:hypothetical protein